MNSENPYRLLADWLEKEAADIRTIEREAYVALHEQNDDSAYRDLMRSKALKLASLAEQGDNIVDVKDRPDLRSAMNRISRFSQSAAQSLEVGSVFFMSALLYPEEHKDGEANDLENFIAELKSLA
ncbi:hypothetical protein [Maridesulfovibrio sp.]|uniref:hypothetical protein n=1 Tax=Maridesulfovibrio sp. TaxID=2795000 RepID=UPI0029F57084|nr:hypothetical protein [Maridesulfovibrio sp.]